MPFIYAKEILDNRQYDVIVVGSGSAGATAAIAAGRSGAKALLLERLPFLGGTSTAVLDTFYGSTLLVAAPAKWLLESQMT